MLKPLILITLLLLAPTTPPAVDQRWIQHAADAHHLDPALLRAIIHVESGGDPTAIGPCGEIGLMQIMPATIDLISAYTGLPAEAIRADPATNIWAGAYYLRRMLNRFDNDLQLAIAAYNTGPGRVIDAGNRVPPIAYRYLDRVYRAWGQPPPTVPICDHRPGSPAPLCLTP